MAILTRPQPKGKDAALVALIERKLDGLPRCHDCRRPLYSLRSILLGRGPRCRAKMAGLS
jgi:ribosomal protein L34E